MCKIHISSFTPHFRNSTVPDQMGGIAWAVINRLFIIVQVTVLAFSELGWFAPLFDKFFPVVGSEFGLGALGIFQCLIGGTVLSHYVPKLTLVSGFFLFSIGCLNIVIGLVLGVSAKTIRSGGMQESDSLVFQPSVPHRRPPSLIDDSLPEPAPRPSGSSGLGFGRQAEKAAMMKGSLSLCQHLSFDLLLTFWVSSGIQVPRSPPPLPIYSSPRPPKLEPLNASPTS